MPWKDKYTVSDEIGIRDRDIVWPAGVTCGFVAVVDLNPATGPNGIDAASVSSPTVQFGLHEGIDHFLALFARHGVRATFATPAYFAAVYPDTIARIAAAGHEIAANGLAGENPRGLAPAEERARMSRARDMLADVAGAAPTGWFSLPRTGDPFATGMITPDTLALARELGFTYFGNGLADDAPHYCVTDFESRSALLALPYYYHFDDRFFLMFPEEGTGLERPAALLRNWRAEFDAQHRRGRYFAMTVSPFRSAWQHRFDNLSTFLAETAARPGVWFASGREIAAHWQEVHPAHRTLKLAPSIWADHPGSLS